MRARSNDRDKLSSAIGVAVCAENASRRVASRVDDDDDDDDDAR